MIVFTCWDSNMNTTTYYANNRKEALNMVKNHWFDKYINVVVSIEKEKFNLNSKRGYNYFGIKNK